MMEKNSQYEPRADLELLPETRNREESPARYGDLRPIGSDAYSNRKLIIDAIQPFIKSEERAGFPSAKLVAPSEDWKAWRFLRNNLVAGLLSHAAFNVARAGLLSLGSRLDVASNLGLLSGVGAYGGYLAALSARRRKALNKLRNQIADLVRERVRGELTRLQKEYPDTRIGDARLLSTIFYDYPLDTPLRSIPEYVVESRLEETVQHGKQVALDTLAAIIHKKRSQGVKFAPSPLYDKSILFSDYPKPTDKLKFVGMILAGILTARAAPVVAAQLS